MSGEREPYSLHGSIGYRMTLAARLQERRLEVGLRSLGLTRTSWCILLALGMEGRKYPSDIASFVGIDRTATSRTLRRMEETGMVRRGAGKGDGRRTRVEITDHGRALLKQAIPHARTNNTRLLGKLSATQAEELSTLLNLLLEGEETGFTTL